MEHSQKITEAEVAGGGPVQSALVNSFNQDQKWCSTTWAKVTNWVPDILEHHVSARQVGVFLGALYQVMCNQQQGITSVVVAQAGVPLHLSINNWRTQRSLTWLFVQVINWLGPLASLTPVPQPRSTGAQQWAVLAVNTKYTPILPQGVELVPTVAWEVNCLSEVGPANRPITLSTDNDSGFKSVDLRTPVRTLPTT